jgi:adenine-specific DNA-methyltransferase
LTFLYARRVSIGTTNPFAKQLRRDQTDVEELLWQHLRNRQLGGLKFRRQATVGRGIPDFICAEKRLIVELDGGQHSEETDAERTAKLEALGCKIIRFWNNEVNENLDGVLERIIAEANALSARFKSRQPSSNSD